MAEKQEVQQAKININKDKWQTFVGLCRINGSTAGATLAALVERYIQENEGGK